MVTRDEHDDKDAKYNTMCVRVLVLVGESARGASWCWQGELDPSSQAGGFEIRPSRQREFAAGAYTASPAADVR